MHTSPLGTAWHLLALLNRTGPTTASNTALADALGVSPRTVNYAISDLVDAELVIRSTFRRHRANHPTGRVLAIREGAKLPNLHGITVDTDFGQVSA